MADINLGVGGANSAVAGGYDIEYSVKNEQDNGERFQSTNLGTPSSTKIFTFSMWVKRTEIINRHFLSYQANTGITVSLAFANDSSTQALYYFIYNSATDAYGKTTALFRDTSAWYHIVWRVDTTQATAADRIRIYVNGVQQDLESGNGSASIYPSQNYDVPLQTTHYLLGFDGSSGFCGYCSQYYYIDGQSLAPTDFGEFDSATGIWKPIEYTGTFGNAGYYLDFADASALGKDVGNSKGNFSHYGGSSADQATDTPTNNFATFNPLIPSADMSFSNGATDVTSTAAGWDTAFGSIGVSTGKWYFEYLITATDGSQMGGVADEADIYTLSSGKYVGESANSVGYYGNDGIVRINGSTVATYNTYQQIPTMSIALDLDNGKVYFRRYDTWQGSSDPVNGTNGITLPTGGTGTWFFAQSSYFASSLCMTNHGGFTTNWNIAGYTDGNGYGNFAFEPPSGYYALCSKNLAEFG